MSPSNASSWASAVMLRIPTWGALPDACGMNANSVTGSGARLLADGIRVPTAAQ